MMVSPGLLLLGLNFTGAAAYLALAMRGWRDATEGGVVPVTGEPFVWAVCLPVLFTFVLVNMIWSVLLILRKRQERLSFLATAMIWVGTLVIDMSHH